MRFEVKLTSRNKELQKYLDQVASKLVDDLCVKAQGQVRQKVGSPPGRHGAWYRRARFRGYRPRPRPGVQQPDARKGKVVGWRMHQASAPGEAPARDYGWLQHFISYKTKKRVGHYEGVVGPDLKETPYAVNLEKGIGMAPRPFMRPVWDESSREWRQYGEKQASAALRHFDSGGKTPP